MPVYPKRWYRKGPGIPVYQADEREARHFWPSVYFHGEMEDWVLRNKSHSGASDLVGSPEPLPVREGEYKVDVYGKPGRFIFWSVSEGDVLTWNGIAQKHKPSESKIYKADKIRFTNPETRDEFIDDVPENYQFWIDRGYYITGLFETIKRFKGLIVDPGDKPSINYAIQAFNTKIRTI